MQSPQSHRRQNSNGSGGTDSAVAAIYARFSSELQDAKSIDDQERECRERAVQDGYTIQSGQVFSDSAVSGTKLRRNGLDKLLAAARSGEFQALYFHSLSRLARESVITMPMLKELVYVHQIRVISLTEGIDTSRQGWEINATFSSLHHEQYIKDLSANVHRGQIGTVMSNFSVGDYPLGYSSVPSPNGEMIGRGGNMKPRKVYVIAPEEAEWVRRIFHWYVVERMSLRSIVIKLTQLKAPKNHRSSTSTWHRSIVIRILRSPKYIGLWPWGKLKNVRNPLTGKVHQEARPEEESRNWCRDFPELRIIEDDLYDAAQKLLDKNNESCRQFRKKDGRLNGSAKGRPGMHLLSGIVECASCGSSLYVGGSDSQYMFCRGARDGFCRCKTQLLRQRAEQFLLNAIGERILANPTWQEAVYNSLVGTWQQTLAARPDEAREIQQRIDTCDRVIQRLVDSIEQSDDPDPDVARRLRERRTERNELATHQKQLSKPPAALQNEPTREWCNQQLFKLGEVLRSTTPAAGIALRDLLGGPVVVEEVPVANRKRRFWRGTVVLRLGRVAAAVVPDLRTDVENTPPGTEVTEEITLDFRTPTKTELQGDIAWPMMEAGSQCQEIAKELGVSIQRVTAIMKAAAAKRGIDSADGRLRQASWLKRNERLPNLQEEVLRLADEGVSDIEIAKRVNLNAVTVGQIISITGR